MPEINEKAPLLDEKKIGNVTASATFTFTVTASEYLGRVNLGWSQNCPARLQDCWIGLYKGSFPSDPNTNLVTFTWAEAAAGTFLTNEPWGTGWCAAMVAKDGAGRYVYVVKTPITG